MLTQVPVTETAVRGDSTEATRLYQRGVAAARAGQKRIAAGYLSRSVQHDPQHEGAWLWLGSVLDDPAQSAFCLKTVLKLNPDNERARQGLRWLEQKHGQVTPQRPTVPSGTTTSSLSTAAATRNGAGAAPAPERDQDRDDAWWVQWRHLGRDKQWSRVLLWLIPVVVLGLLLGLHYAVSQAVARDGNTTVITAAPPVQDGGGGMPLATLLAPLVPEESATEDGQAAMQVLDSDMQAVRQSQAIIYVDQFNRLRGDLQAAVDDYRYATDRPAAPMSYLAATRTYQARVRNAYDTLKAMAPPRELQEPHETYLLGLEQELEGIADLQEYYGNYRPGMANQAAVHFQDATTYYAQSRAMLDARMQQIGELSQTSPQVIR